VVNVTTTEAELFTIKCSINQATALPGISNIAVLIDSIHTARRIFDYYSLHPFQIHMAAISAELRIFFSKNHDNSIEFWECLSCCKWPFHKVVNEETKQFHPYPQYSCKSSWNFSKKNKYDDILLELTYSKGET